MFRVGLVDDRTLVREGIKSLLALTDEVDVVGEGADGDDALDLAETGGLDVLLLDLRMPRRDGIATLGTLAERGPTVPVLVLTTFDDELVPRALRAGARAYLPAQGRHARAARRCHQDAGRRRDARPAESHRAAVPGRRPATPTPRSAPRCTWRLGR